MTGYSKPVASFVTDHQQSDHFLPEVQFQDQSTADVVSWQWNFGDGNSLAGPPVVSHSYAAAMPGNDFYQFVTSLIVTTTYGCVDTTFKVIDFNPAFSFYIPNTFTPNADHANNTFYGKGYGITQYEIEIFDRWGLKIWSCSNEGSNIPWDYNGAEGMSSSCRWDGTYNGERVEQDVYVWKVMLTDVFGKRHAYIGRVTLLY